MKFENRPLGMPSLFTCVFVPLAWALNAAEQISTLKGVGLGRVGLCLRFTLAAGAASLSAMSQRITAMDRSRLTTCTLLSSLLQQQGVLIRNTPLEVPGNLTLVPCCRLSYNNEGI